MKNTITSLIQATASRDAELKKSSNGNPYVRLVTHTGEGDERQFVTLMIFGDEAIEESARLKRGDPLSAVGTLSVSIYQNRPSLSMMTSRLLTLSAKPKAKPRAPAKPKKQAVSGKDSDGFDWDAAGQF